MPRSSTICASETSKVVQNKAYSEACAQNREPIRSILQGYVQNRHQVLEIGSGTGQHAVYFATDFPWLTWQTSDVPDNHDAIQAWIDDSGLSNVLPPLSLDVTSDPWPQQRYDLIYTANTLHIMSSPAVQKLFAGVPACLNENAVFLIYGPVNYGGQYTSESNAQFDRWLKQRDAASGIKNFEWLADIARFSGLECVEDFPMPANNRILVWQKSTFQRGMD